MPWIKNLLDSRNLAVYLHPVLKFSGESIPMSVNELWFGLHFACLLKKAWNFELLPMESGSPVKGVRPYTDVSLHMLFPFSNTLPCLVCLVNSCSFCKTLLKCHVFLEPPLSGLGHSLQFPDASTNTCYSTCHSALIVGLSLVCTVGCESLQSRDHVSFQVCPPRA